jgi:GNAT superfamily N-acetyltransferase
MAELVPFDPDIHKEEFVRLDTEYNTWLLEQTKEKYQVDIPSTVGITVPKVVEGDLEILTRLKPPEVIFYLVLVDGEIAGMGGIKKLSDEAARIMWMYLRPDYRGKGYGRHLFNRLVEDGRMLGYSLFQLRAPKFGPAALHIYRSAGFRDIGEGADNLLSPLHRVFQPQWIDMEKRELLKR